MRSNKFIESVIKAVNPLELPQKDGTSYVFNTRLENYVFFMEKGFEVAPKGYMDLLVILVELYGWRFSKALNFYNDKLKKVMGNRISMFKLGEGKSKIFYRKLIICLHNQFKTDFDLDAFEKAWEIHKQHVQSKILNVTDYEQRKKTKA